MIRNFFSRCALGTLMAMVMAATFIVPVRASAQGDSWPSHVVRIIVPFDAGGPTDLQARWMAVLLTKALGQSFIVENRGAAGGSAGAFYVAQSAPDGYTLLFANPGPLTIEPQIRDTHYTIKRFAPVILVANTPSCVVVKSDMPIKTFQDLVAAAKRAPGKINYGSPGVGTLGHLTTELIAKRAGIKLTHIPYSGAAPEINDLLGGQIDMAVMQLGSCIPLAQQGKVRALAVTSLHRVSQLPNVPTLDESGLTGFDSGNWNGLLAPKGTPPAILQKINNVIAQALTTPAAKAWLLNQGYMPVGTSFGAFSTFLDNETARWGDLIKTEHLELKE